MSGEDESQWTKKDHSSQVKKFNLYTEDNWDPPKYYEQRTNMIDFDL